MKTLDKLSVRTSDYVAAINVHEKLLSSLVACSRGVAYSGKEKPIICRSVNKISKLEDSVFDKVIVSYSPHIHLGELIRVADHKGMVLVTRTPDTDVVENMTSYLERNGIFETWLLRNATANHLDLLFRVRKYD